MNHMSTFSACLRLASLVFLLAACGGDASTGDWAGSVTDSAGVTVIDNPEEGLWGDETPWRLEEELRIGGMDAPEESQFGLVAALDVDATGNVYALDMQAAQVRVFDGEGGWLRTLGGPGGGPGELSPQAVAVFVVGDDLWVGDIANQRVTRWGLDGSERPALSLDFTRGIPFRWDRLGGDRIVAQLRSIPGSGMQGESMGDPIVTVGAEVTDTLAVLPQGTTISMEGGAPRFRFLDREPLWDAEGGMLLTASNDSYRIEVRNADGALERVVKKAHVPREVTPGDETRMLRAIRTAMADQGLPPAAVDQLLQNASFGDHFPAMSQVLGGADGTVWVQRLQTPDEIAESGELNLQDLGSDEWEVFDDEGRYLGVLAFPARFTPMRVIGDAFWGVQRDDLDVASIVRYRLVRG
jgi:hypothetical protein